MKIRKTAANLVVSALLFGAAAAAVAQDHHDDDKNRPRDEHAQPHRYVEHKEWHKGAKMRQEDWSRGERIDYHAHHLNAPPRGYEWREVDGNFVLAAVATGVIANVIADSVR